MTEYQYHIIVDGHRVGDFSTIEILKKDHIEDLKGAYAHGHDLRTDDIEIKRVGTA